VKAISQAYAQEGYKRGDNAVKDMLKIFCERKLITKDKDGYHYHPALLPLK
jgi:repressor of nif and glnA expression